MELCPVSQRTDWPFSSQAWDQTPPVVQAYLRTMQDELTQFRQRMETLAAQRKQTSMTSHRPPSSDSPYQRPRQWTASVRRAKRAGNRGIRAIVQYFCHPQRCVSLRTSGVPVATQCLR